MTLDELARGAAELGLLLRGAFHPRPEDGVPALAGGRLPGTLVLLGNAGPDLWARFEASPERTDGLPDALDRWTRRVVGDLSGRFGAEAWFPFGGPPYRPFVAWAKRAEAVAESPLGLLIHPDYGLWHAYRAALGLEGRLSLPPADPRPRPCDACAEKPCLTACPVGAFTAEGYDVAGCARHVRGPMGGDCLDLACRARRACPVGASYAYGSAQARFHMEAFLGRRGGGAE